MIDTAADDVNGNYAWWHWGMGAFWAIVAPTLIAAHDPPSVTFYNQVLAVAGWGLWIAALNWVPGHRLASNPATRTTPAQWGVLAIGAVLCINGLKAIESSVWGSLPGGLGMLGAGMSAAAAAALWSGWRTGLQVNRNKVFDLFAAALCLAGALGMVLAVIQAFVPDWADGTFIAEPTMVGRAVGNLRQPNHFSTMLVWSCVGAAWLGARARLPAWLSAGLMTVFIWGIVLTASRTGMVAMAFLLLWGVLDKRLPRAIRVALIAAPVLYALFWGAMWLLAHADKSVTFAAEARLHDKSDISSSRFKIWANVFGLIAAHPWTGVGYGEFNVAWTLTPFPTRPVAFFDHTHNLPLQWAVEFGLPLACLMVLLSALAWVVLVRPRPGESLTAAGACAVIVTTAAFHSLLEYPLCYSYFLLPTAFAWGAGLAAQVAPQPDRTPLVETSPFAWVLTVAGIAITVSAAWCAWDYQAAANIYAPRKGAGPLEERIAYGQHKPWFGYQADYADVTVPDDDEPPKPPHAFKRTLHNLVDARLMIAYARSLDAAGQSDKASYVVARLKEFHNPMEKPFLSVCKAATTTKPVAPQPFQCVPPKRDYTWREVLPQ